MKPDDQRIAIAEWMGWKWYRIPHSEAFIRGPVRTLFNPLIHEYDGQSPAWLVRADGTERVANMPYMEREGHLPNYTKDLNAMHDAERQMFESNPGYYNRSYVTHLQDVLKQESELGVLDKRQACEVATTTAAQRAEAFLRTLGLWKEEEK
ncbi:MAG TPA: hypothetical protein VNU68_29175 [Verrucomicrobiae bacterium]|nr:hypothetical protein [Verrucomicrobiae bacterium]